MRRRTLAELRNDGEEHLFAPAFECLERLGDAEDPRVAGFLDARRPMLIARAPGRLDVMGGIADYSGSMVLELPLARATFAMLQPRPGTAVEFLSLRAEGPSYHATDIHRLAEEDDSAGKPFGAAGAGATEWSRYVVGVARVCLRLAGTETSTRAGGFRVLIHSTVPEGKGVSSSAALEVAVMGAVAGHLALELSGEEMAAACQWVENHVVGAPCGIMDQLTSALGQRNRLLAIRCQPGTVLGKLAIPAGYRFFGIDSGVRHAVSGADYTTVRAAAFMGLTLTRRARGARHPLPQGGRGLDMEAGYLANLSPEEFEEIDALLPEWMSGGEFLERFGSHGDPVTTVEPGRLYPVRVATRHPVFENARVERFAELLQALPRSPSAATEMGELMYGSHESYGACGLGSEATDRLVGMVREVGSAGGLFGARITGGGSGGTVAVFGVANAESEVRRIAASYAREMGRATEVFAESGPGMEVVTIR